MFEKHQQIYAKSKLSKSTLDKKLRIESLEDRRMLATLVVTDLGDDTLANLAGDGQLSLREAVEAVNTGAPVDGIPATAGVFGNNDTILFSSALFLASPKTIALTAGQLELTSGVTIAGPVVKLLTIDAQENSRHFDITASLGDFTFNQLTLTNGMTTGLGQQGGAVRSISEGQLRIINSDLVENATTGPFAQGGAVWSGGDIFIEGSTIQNNHTEGTGAGGGGVFSFQNLVINSSTVADNSTTGNFSSGGGVGANGMVSLSSSTVSGNKALGTGASVGGVLGDAGVVIADSTVSGNQAMDDSAAGGGVSSAGPITIDRSTIVENQALGANAVGGGVHTTSTNIDIYGSIIANNSAGGGNADIDPGTGTLTVEFSLIGDTTGLTIPAATNILDEDPMLGPLSGNGRTQTHAPLPGSPVIDQGDPNPSVSPSFDQRGAPFLRFVDGDGNGEAIMDIGSHELQADSADFNADGDIDGLDFLAWQRGFGANNALASDGDSDRDGDVDAVDLSNWQEQYPQSPPGRVGASVDSGFSDEASLLSAVLGLDIGDSDSNQIPSSSLQPTTYAAESALDQAFAQSDPGLPARVANVDEVAQARASERTTAPALSLDDELIDDQF